MLIERIKKPPYKKNKPRNTYGLLLQANMISAKTKKDFFRQELQKYR